VGEREVRLWIDRAPGAGPATRGRVPGPGPVPLWVKDLPAPDWYPDPSDHEGLRFWDGSRWAEAVRPTTAHRGGDTTSGHGRPPEVAYDGKDPSAVEMRDEKRAPMRAALFSSFTRAHGDGGVDATAPGAPRRDVEVTGRRRA
jgi:hypothetical protein